MGLTIDEMRLMERYCERPENPEVSIGKDMLAFILKGVVPKLISDENDGKVSYVVPLGKMDGIDMTNEQFYSLCEHGWRIEDDKFILTLDK